MTVLGVFILSGHLYSMYCCCRLENCNIYVIHLLKALWRSYVSVAIVSWQREILSFEELTSEMRFNHFQMKHDHCVEYKLQYNIKYIYII